MSKRILMTFILTLVISALALVCVLALTACGDDPSPEPSGPTQAETLKVTDVVLSSSSGNTETYTITFNDGSTYSFTVRNGADGADGIGIEDAEVNPDGELVLILTDESTINVGMVAGVGISDISLENYELTITLTNGTVLELGNIRGEQGEAGKSAYELAVENGYEGTLEEWLDSLYGGHDKLLTAEAENASAGKTRGSGIYTSGESVTIEALPFVGYDFVGWYDGEELVSAEEEYTFAMPGDNTTYEARFQKAAGFENFYFTSDFEECKITGYDGFPGEELIIPEGVTRIGDYAFGDLHNVKTLIVADSVTYVGAHAFDSDFNHAHALTKIHIGDNIEYIGVYAFHLGGYDVDEVYFEGDISKLFAMDTSDQSNVGFFGTDKFYVNGELLTDLVVPEGVTRINDYIFNDYDLNGIILPTSIGYIGERTFGEIGAVYYEGTREEWQNVSVNSSYITEFNVYYYSETEPSEVGRYWHYVDGVPTLWFEFVPSEGLEITDGMITGIGTCTDTVLMLDMPVADNAFEGNTAITGVVFGDGVTSIGDGAFRECRFITNVTFISSPYSIGERAFYRCAKLTDVVLPEGVETIGKYAFAECSNLRSAELPDSIYLIGDGLFAGCWRLSDVNIPRGISELNYNFFAECMSLTDIVIPDNIVTIGHDAFARSGLTQIDIPDSVKSIGSSAFWACKFSDITIPASVTEISTYTFYDCDNLKSIEVAPGNPVYHSDGNCIIETASKTLIAGCKNSVISDDGSVTSIARASLPIERGTTTLYIPASITNIEADAFIGCNDLISITVAEDNPVYHSDGNCIIETASKTLIVGCKASVIPDDGSVTTIGASAFGGCIGLTDITIPAAITNIEDLAFSGCNNLVEVRNESSLEFTYSELANKHIYSSADGESWLTKTADGYVFYYDGESGYLVGYNGSETDIVLPDGFVAYDGTEVTRYEIGESAFANSNVVSVVIPDSVTYIGHGAFSDCRNLVSVTIGSGTTGIGSEAFSSCTELTSITFPESVTSIGGVAFYRCIALTSVTFEDPEGWSVSSFGTGENGTSLSSSVLSDPSLAAEYVTAIYYDGSWTRG